MKARGAELAATPPVTIKWRKETDPRRLRRVAEILADILDTATVDTTTRSGGG